MKIILGTFKGNANELADFLGPRVGTKPTVSGGELEFDDDEVRKTVKPRHVKTYVKRFLNRKGERSNYQILVEGTELRMIELEKEKGEKEKKDRGKQQTESAAEGSRAESDEAKEGEGGAKTEAASEESSGEQEEEGDKESKK